MAYSQFCAILGCNMTRKVAQDTGSNISFFCIPRNESIRAQWVKKCKPTINASYAKVCSLHFQPDDFENYMMVKLLKNTRTKLMLKKTAVPTQKLGLTCKEEKTVPVTPPTPDTNTPQQVNGVVQLCCTDSNGNQKIHLILPIIQCNTTPTAERIGDDTATNKACQTEITSSFLEAEKNTLQHTIDVLTLENNNLKESDKNRQKLEIEKKVLEHKFYNLTDEHKYILEKAADKQILITKLRREIAALKQKIRRHNTIKQNKTAKTKIISDVMHGILTKRQQQIILTKKRVKWGEEDISTALTLRYLGKRSYNYLTKHLNYPLPSESTLHKWTAKINADRGILHSMFKFLSAAGNNFSPQEKIVVLAIDELKVSETVEYDPKEDKMVGPYSYLQVVMARGLFATWKQPVFADFDVKITKLILEELIKMLYEIGFEVVACVSDCSPSKIDLWNELDISYDSTSIPHNCTGNDIYFFVDAPHLLKSIRDWLLDSEFTINDTTINKFYIEKLVNDCNAEVNSLYKIGKVHVDCEGAQRQNVRLAAQLLSHTTATALKRHYGHHKEAILLSNFIELVNNWFDIMNSNMPSNAINFKCGYGKHLNLQMGILNSMSITMKGLRFKNEEIMQTFQEGIVMSINSLNKLYEGMKNKFKIEHILTRRLNKGVVEIFFSQILKRCNLTDDPTPLNVLQEMQALTLGKLGYLNKNITLTKSVSE